MAILGSIRKRPLFLILIIGLAIFAFILADGINSNGPTSSNIGSVNGEDITNEEFSRIVENQKSRRPNVASSLVNVNSAWNTILREKVYLDAIEKAGVVIGENDIWNYMINSPGNQNSPQFQNEEGLFDEDKLKEYIATLKGAKDTKAQWIANEKSIVKYLKQTTYDNLVKAGLTASLKDGQRNYFSENSSADIDFVYYPHSLIEDSEVKVTDTEITTYIKSHEDKYKTDATREIEYVNFEIKPSTEDIETIKANLALLINDFPDAGQNITGLKNTKDNAGFVNEYSDTNYDDKVFFTNDLATGIYDTIQKLPLGSVYGPYKDGDYFKIVKYVANKDQYEVKSSHILIGYVGAPGSGPNVKRTKEEAEKFAKGLKVTASNFEEMAKTNSDDLRTANVGGSRGDWVVENKSSFIEEYNDFIFKKKKGNIGVVETIRGYHIVIVDDTKTTAGLSLAIVSQKIESSEATESDIYQNAETFAADLATGKDIIELAKTNNLAVKKANKLTDLSEKINELGDQREIVKWTFERNTKIGAVKRFDLENSFTVVRLKNKNKKGLTTVAVAKPSIVPILEKIKKGDLIKAKMTGATLEEIATAVGKEIKNSKEVSIIKPSLSIGGKNDNIAGALLYMNEGDIKIINGENGVYAIKVLKKSPMPDIKKYDTYSKKITTQLQNKGTQIFNALKDASNIEDNRAKFY